MSASPALPVNGTPGTVRKSRARVSILRSIVVLVVVLADASSSSSSKSGGLKLWPQASSTNLSSGPEVFSRGFAHRDLRVRKSMDGFHLYTRWPGAHRCALLSTPLDELSRTKNPRGLRPASRALGCSILLADCHVNGSSRESLWSN